MKVKEEVLEKLGEISAMLNQPDLPEAFTKAISSKTEMTWVELAGATLPVIINSIEQSKIVMSSETKAAIANSLVLPLIKNKLPWYVKPFAAKMLGWIIDLIVSSLNKLFTKKWKEVKEATDLAATAEKTAE